MTECRICFDSNHEERGNLISPCKCSGSQKYIHEECLQRWRDEEINQANRDSCEICRTNFHIVHDHCRETYIIQLYEGPWVIPILYYIISNGMFSICLYQYDRYSDFATVKLIVQNDLNQTLISLIETDEMFRFIYYILFTSFILSNLYLLLFGLSSTCHVNRLYRYWKSQAPSFMAYGIICNSFLLILYFGIYTNSLDVFMNLAVLPTLFHLPFINNMHFVHNTIIHTMNREPNHEKILSIEDNTSSEIV